jgi:uncharacterized protein (TIGR02996 family)
VTTEDDFQAKLDADPDDWQTRLVFADWLEERGDPRAEGYRALGVSRKRPHSMQYQSTKKSNTRLWWWEDSTADSSNGGHCVLSDDWAAALDIRRSKDGFYPRVSDKQGPNTRREVEDAAARAFAKLPAARRAELCATPPPTSKPKRKRAKRKK